MLGVIAAGGLYTALVSPGAGADAAAALPEYVAGDLHLGKDANAPFEVCARPDAERSMRVVVYAFAIEAGASPGREPNPVDARVDLVAGGGACIKGRVRALEGASELRIVIAAPGAIARFEDAMTRAKDRTSDVRARVLAVPIVRD